MAWSDELFRIRVAKRCKQLGRSQRAVLKDAKLAHDFLHVVPAHSRRVDTLEKIAKALDWSLPEVMGLELIGQADVELMIKTVYVARKVVSYLFEPNAELEAQILTSIYNILLDRQHAGQPIDQPILDLIAEMMTKREATAAARATRPSS
ncbi:MAG TPA: hypothetical protein VLN57_07465 [Xanthobacteraceae bacterium]|nr:hypothetical protein [Xanthobacteraceae bacterium]